MGQIRTAPLGVSLLKGVFGFCVMAILAVFVRMSFHQQESYEDQRRALRLERLAKLQTQDREKLAGYGWTDKAAGIVRIPIQEAMTLTLADLKAKPVVSSTVKAAPGIVNVVPPYLQAPLPAATPAKP